jgi:HK97 family phage major capsid protein
VREIMAIGNLHGRNEMAQKAVAEDVSLDEFRGQVLAELAKTKPAPSPEIGMSEREIKQFSFVRAINALANPQDRKAQEAAKFEFEASRAQADKLGRASRGITIPHDVAEYSRRDLITGTGTGTAKGGNLVATDLLSGSFIDALRNKMVLPQLGATFLTGLQGNVAIPKKTTASTSYWVGENSAPTEGNLVFGQVTMSPKTLAAYVDFSRRLSIQSSLDVEALVRNDLAAGIAVALDEAALGGAKTNGPTGVRGTSGIGSVAIGTNGGAPTWASIVSLIREVEIDNALNGAAAFVTNPKVKAKLMATPKQASGIEGNFLLGPDYGSLAGYPFVVSNQIPSNLTKAGSGAVCSAMIFGVWSDLLIGQWSGIDLLVDPYTGSKEGTVRVTAFVDTDVAVRYAESFAAVLDYTTT